MTKRITIILALAVVLAAGAVVVRDIRLAQHPQPHQYVSPRVFMPLGHHLFRWIAYSSGAILVFINILFVAYRCFPSRRLCHFRLARDRILVLFMMIACLGLLSAAYHTWRAAAIMVDTGGMPDPMRIPFIAVESSYRVAVSMAIAAGALLQFLIAPISTQTTVTEEGDAWI